MKKDVGGKIGEKSRVRRTLHRSKHLLKHLLGMKVMSGCRFETTTLLHRAVPEFRCGGDDALGRRSQVRVTTEKNRPPALMR